MLARLILTFCLCLAVASGEPVATRADGPLGELPITQVGRPLTGKRIPLKGRYFQGEVEISRHLDLRDCRQLNVRVRLKNTGRVGAFCAFYVVITDAKGNFLGGEGFREDTFSQEPGKVIERDKDIALPIADNDRAAFYQLILYEDTRGLQVVP